MTALTAVRAGIRQVVCARRLWLTYYLATLLCGLAAALPLAALAGSSLGGTTWAARMHERFELDWLIELGFEHGDAIGTALGPAALVLFSAYLLLATFLSGGAIAHFASGAQRYDAAAFWGACGRHFARLLRLLIYSGVLYFAVLFLNGQLESAGRALFAGGMEERPVALFAWGRAALTLLLLAYVNMVMDYARVRLVVEDSRASLSAVLGAFRFTVRHFTATAGAFAIVLVMFAALAAAGHVLVRVLPWVLVIIAQQAFVLGRLFLKLLFYASATNVYLALRPLPVPDPEPVPESAAPPAIEAPDQPPAPLEDVDRTRDADALVGGAEEEKA